jgi:hypothetical protein
MTSYWQEIIVAAIVLAAVAYLARQLWRVVSRKRAGGCGAACGNCPTASEGPPLVSLDVPPQMSAKRQATN